jgi:hypothetical protein
MRSQQSGGPGKNERDSAKEPRKSKAPRDTRQPYTTETEDYDADNLEKPDKIAKDEHIKERKGMVCVDHADRRPLASNIQSYKHRHRCSPFAFNE